MKTLLFFLVLLVSVAATAQVAPGNFTIDVVSNSELRLIWKHDGRGIDKFRIDRSLDGMTYSPLKTINNTTDRSYTDAGLLPNTVYHYQIVSGLGLRFSDAVKDKATTLSNPPTGFSVTTITPIRIGLVWNSGGTPTQLEYSVNATFSGAATKNFTTQQSGFADGLTPGTGYFFRLKRTAFNGAQESDWVEIKASTPNPTPATPTGLAIASKNTNSIGVKWNAVAAVEGYQVRRSSVPDFRTATTQDVASSLTTYTFSGLNDNTTYYMQVRARNTNSGADYWSNWSGTLTASTDLAPPVGPSPVRATPKSPTQVDVTWANNSDNEEFFVISRSTTGLVGPWTEAGVVNADIKLFTDNGARPNTTYYYQVCAKNRAGQTCATSAMTTTPQRPPTPPEYSLQALSSTEIKVDYRNTAGALANVLELQYSTDGNFGSVLGGQNVPVAGSTVTIGSLQANTRYYFRLRASNTTAQLASDWVLKDVATQPAAITRPNAPTNLSLSGSPDRKQMTVTWTDASNNEDRFDIQSAETADFANPVAANVGAGVGTFTIINLQSCRTYFVRVSAANSAGSSAWIDGRLTLNPNVPGKAASLAATTASQTQINLVWTFTANTEEAFELEYADNSGYTGSTKRDLAKASRTENVTGLKVATKYWFRLRGKNCGGNGDWLESTATTLPNTPQPPIAPTNLVATAVSDSEISLTWTDNSDETGFDVERSPNGVTGWDYIRTTAANETTFKDNGLMALTRYVYRVQARRIDFTSPYSNTATATTLAPPIVAPAAPANLKATAASSNQINLNWDVANGLTGYKLEYADNAGFTNLKTESSLAGSATTFVLQNLLPDTPYFIRLYAVNSAGTSAATGQARTPATPVTLPAAPSVLTIKTAGMGQLEVRWTDNATNEETYELDYSTDTSFGAGLTQLRLAANESNRNLTGLADNTTYHLRVRATNKAGASVWLAGSEKTLPATPSSLQPPINLRFNVSAPVFNQLSLLWNDVATTETGYEVWRSVNDQTNWTRLAELPTNTVAYDDKNLRAGVPYFYRVRAVQNTILSDWSNSITDQSPLVNAINAPAEVRVYPNPATDRLTVAHPLRGPLLVRLVSSQGLVVLEQFDAGIVGTVSLEVSSVPTGFYLLLLSGETTRFSIPILKY